MDEEQLADEQSVGNLHQNPDQMPDLAVEAEEEEEPICVLKVELDGEHTEQLRIFASKDPRETVEQFGVQFNLSEAAKRRLLSNIYQQIREKDN